MSHLPVRAGLDERPVGGPSSAVRAAGLRLGVQRRPRRRGALRATVTALLVMICAVLPSAPAWAHAALLESDPADGVVLAAQPRQIELRFSEKVATGLGAVKVLAPDGSRADTGEVSTRAHGRAVVAQLRTDLPRGTFVLLWRVVSEDSHPVSGTSTFSVGEVTATGHAHAEEDSSAARQLLPLSRFLLYVGLVLLIGGTSFVLVVWPVGAHQPKVRLLLWVGWASAVVGTVGGLLLQGPYAAGLPLTSALDGPLLREVLASKFGVAAVARTAALVVAAAVLLALVRVRRGVLGAVALPVAVGLLATTSAAGHAGAGSLTAVALPADVLHLAAACAWVGGLAVLLVAALRQTGAPLRATLTAWSRYAATAVALLVVTGAFAAWREVREVEALASTAYGQLLLWKTGFVLVMLGLGGLGRAWVRRHYLPVVHASTDLVMAAPQVAEGERSAPTRRDVRHLRRSVLLETGLAAVVLAVTSWLVGTTPARSAYAPVFSETKPVAGDLQVQVDVEPARAGVNDMHVYYTGAGGKAVDVEEATARWSGGDGDVVPVALPRESLGHYEALRVPLTAPGTWQLELTTRTSDVTAHTTVLTVRVR